MANWVALITTGISGGLYYRRELVGQVKAAGSISLCYKSPTHTETTRSWNRERGQAGVEVASEGERRIGETEIKCRENRNRNACSRVAMQKMRFAEGDVFPDVANVYGGGERVR